MKIEIITGNENNPVAEFFSSSNTPETDRFKVKFKTTCGEKYWVPVEHSERLERERNEAREDATNYFVKVGELTEERDELRDVLEQLSLYLSVGMGDETTTAKQYKERILEGIKMLTDPLMDIIKESEEDLKNIKKLHCDQATEMLGLVFENRSLEQKIDTLNEMLDMQTKIVVDLEMRLMKNEQADQI